MTHVRYQGPDRWTPRRRTPAQSANQGTLQKLPDPWLPRVVLWIERKFRHGG